MKTRVALDRVLLAASATAQLGWERLRTGLVFNPTSKAFKRDPYRVYRELRERDPVHRSWAGGGYVLTRHRDVVAVLRDPRFGADERTWKRWTQVSARLGRAGIPDPYQEGGGNSMLRRDPPDHTRLRNLVSKAFTPRAVAALAPRIETIAKELLDPLGAHGSFELVRDFAAPLPVTVIAEMLGVPGEDRDQFRHWSDEVIRTLGESSLEDYLASRRAMEALAEYFSEKAEERRRAPRGDLLSELVAAEDAGDKLSTPELLATCVLLLVAGNETTTNLIASGTLALLENPEALGQLRRDPGEIPAAVDELLRFTSPVQLTSRFAKADLELAGVRMRRGEQVVTLLAAANRDPDVFAEPDRLDLRRGNAREHVGFGHGIHFCLGAQLARLEAKVAFEALVTRYPQLRLATERVVWGGNTVLRGPEALPLAF